MPLQGAVGVIEAVPLQSESYFRQVNTDKKKPRVGTLVSRTALEFQTSFPGVWRAYEGFREACDQQGPLDAKARELIKMAISVALGRHCGLIAHRDHCRAYGVTEKEIAQAVLLAASLAGFPGTLAAFRVLQKRPWTGKKASQAF